MYFFKLKSIHFLTFSSKIILFYSHLEQANNNILNVGGKMSTIRNETKTMNHDNVLLLTDLKNQIDTRLDRQHQTNSKLSKSIRALNQTVTNPALKTAPILQQHHHPSHQQLRSQPLHHTHPPPPVVESTQLFLDRIRREANDRVNEVLRRTEKKQERDETIDRLRNFLDQQNKDKTIEDQRVLQTDLSAANNEIHALKVQLQQIKSKIQQAPSNEANILRSTLEGLTSERAEMENKIINLSSELAQLKANHSKEIESLQNRYMGEIDSYQQQYDKQLRNLQRKSEKSPSKGDLKFLQEENTRMGQQLGILGHELDKRDLDIADLRSQLALTRPDDVEGRLFDKQLLASIGSILQDLGAPALLKNFRGFEFFLVSYFGSIFWKILVKFG